MSRTPFFPTSALKGERRLVSGHMPGMPGLLCGGLLIGCLIVESLVAQAPGPATYPVDPTAAAGMTRGLPSGVTGQQAEMMQVRTSAQGAQGEAAAALMARSADQTIEDRNQEIALQAAREKKSIKESMSERLKFERAATSYNKVSGNDMSTWKTDGGGVRVERNVPDAFLMSIIEEEEEASARKAASGEKKGFGLFRKDSDSSDSGGGFLSSIRPPRLPFMGGGGGGEATVASAPPASDTSEPSFARTAGSAPAQAQAPAQAPAQAQASAPKPGVVPMISGAALVDGRSPVNANETPASAARTPSSSSQTVSFADRIPDTEKKKSGLFSKLQSSEEEDNSPVPTSSSGGSGGFFGFGKKKSAPSGGTIDAGLFPEGSASQAAIGTRLSPGSTASSSSGGDSFASASPGGVAPSSTASSMELPGQTTEKTRGFSIPKPSLSIPSISKTERGGGGNVPTMTTVNSSGTSYYVVASTAQFMVYGENQAQSEVRAVPAGSIVLMTKPGEQWASVRLPNGTEGILQNKHLRPATAAESNVEFASPAVAQ